MYNIYCPIRCSERGYGTHWDVVPRVLYCSSRYSLSTPRYVNTLIYRYYYSVPNNSIAFSKVIFRSSSQSNQLNQLIHLCDSESAGTSPNPGDLF